MKRIVIMMFVLVGVLSIAQLGWARDPGMYKWELSGMAGGAFPVEDDQDAGGYFGGRLVYNVTEFVSLGVEAGWMGFEQEDNGIDYGDLTGVPVLGNLILRFPVEATENKLVPYVVGGLGVTFWDFDEGSTLSNLGVDIEDDTSFTAKVGVGADLFVSDTVALFAEGGYIWSEYEASISTLGISDTLDADTLYAQGGVKFAF